MRVLSPELWQAVDGEISRRLKVSRNAWICMRKGLRRYRQPMIAILRETVENIEVRVKGNSSE